MTILFCSIAYCSGLLSIPIPFSSLCCFSSLCGWRKIIFTWAAQWPVKLIFNVGLERWYDSLLLGWGIVAFLMTQTLDIVLTRAIILGLDNSYSIVAMLLHSLLLWSPSDFWLALFQTGSLASISLVASRWRKTINQYVTIDLLCISHHSISGWLCWRWGKIIFTWALHYL